MADKIEEVPSNQGKDPRQTNITGQAAQTGYPGQTNITGSAGQAYITGQPFQTGQTGFPGQPLQIGQTGFTGQQLQTGQPGLSGQPFQTGQLGFAGQPLQTGFPGQTYTPGQVGFQGQPSTNGQTGFRGQAGFPPGQILSGGQLQNQQILTGQTGYPQGVDYPCSDSTPVGQPDLLAVYRTGNFGKNYGKVNTSRGKKWVILHVVFTCLMVTLTTLAMLRMKYLSDSVSYKKYLVLLPCLCCVSDVITCCFAAFFMWRLSSLHNPYKIYTILRFLTIVNICLNINFIVVGPLSSLLFKGYFTVPSGESSSEGSGWGDDGSGGGLGDTDIRTKLVVATKALYACITILMLIKVFVAHSYVFSWWGYLPGGGSTCACCAPLCIMEESSGLAPGIDNPPNMTQAQNSAGPRGVQAQDINRTYGLLNTNSRKT